MNKVKCQWYEQPTNGITHVRIKVNLNNLPEKLRIFVPVFKDLFQNIGTKNYNCEQFNNKLMNSTNGLDISIDKFSHSDDIFDRNDQFLIETSFLDRNIDDAFDCLSELLATPNFDEQDNISDLIRLESVNKAQQIGLKGLEYAISYANGGLKNFAKSFEQLNSDIFFCQFAQQLISTANPKAYIMDAVLNLTEIASYAFR